MEKAIKHPISRQDFLQRMGVIGAASILAPFIPEVRGEGKVRSRIKVAIIGCGSVSTQYLPHLSKADYVELVSACDIIPERAQAAALKYNIPHHYPSIDKLRRSPLSSPPAT